MLLQQCNISICPAYLHYAGYTYEAQPITLGRRGRLQHKPHRRGQVNPI